MIIEDDAAMIHAHSFAAASFEASLCRRRGHAAVCHAYSQIRALYFFTRFYYRTHVISALTPHADTPAATERQFIERRDEMMTIS